MLYLDANFFIFALLDKTKKGENARKLQRDIINGMHNAVTSSLSLDEIMWVLIKNNKAHLLRTAVSGIYSTPNLEIKGVSASVPPIALDFIEKHNLKPRDAFHLAIMKEQNIKEIATDDSDFKKVEWVKVIEL